VLIHLNLGLALGPLDPRSSCYEVLQSPATGPGLKGEVMHRRCSRAVIIKAHAQEPERTSDVAIVPQRVYKVVFAVPNAI